MDRDRLTTEAACRLIRSQLRQHIYGQASKVVREIRQEDDRNLYDLAGDSEKSILASAEADWLSVLRLWPSTDPTLLDCISRALPVAIALSGRFVMEEQPGYESEDARRWIAEFQASFEPKSLLGVPCVLGT